MKLRPPRLAVRALIIDEGRLLLVNAFAGKRSDLWCAPGGGAEAGTSLHENLVREVHEETGLTVNVGPLALVNEFHDPTSGFHQIELFFRCTIIGGQIHADWKDPARVVTDRCYFSQDELRTIRFKPDSIADLAFDDGAGVFYDPLELIAR